MKTLEQTTQPLTLLIATISLLSVTQRAFTQCEVDKLTASDAEEYAYFGVAGALEGGLLIVGAHSDDVVGQDSGAAYIFRLEGADWVEEAKLTASDAAQENNFGASVDLSGELAIAGANGKDGVTLDAGAAYVYRREGQTWVQEAKLVAPDPIDRHRFGSSVAIYGDRAAVGAPYDDDAGGGAGAVYVFRREGTSWVLEDKLTPSGGFGSMGRSVALTDSRVLAGAWLDDDNGMYSGSAYVFRREGQTWTEEGKLLASDGAEGDHFGGSVDLDTDLAVIGAHMADGADYQSGAAYVFRRSGENWAQEAKLTASDGRQYDRFADAAVEGNIVLVGAESHDLDEEFNVGAVYVFDYDSISWTEQLKLVATDGAQNDEFGSAVSLDGGLALVGALGVDTLAGSTGGAYVIQLAAVDTDCNANGLNDDCEPDCDQNGVPDGCEPQDDCNGNGELDVCDLFFGVSFDCNSNDVPDECDLSEGTSEDCNDDLIPDDCQVNGDCNGNSIPDLCDLGGGTSMDCNYNLIPDECDIAEGTSLDEDEDGIPDECASITYRPTCAEDPKSTTERLIGSSTCVSSAQCQSVASGVLSECIDGVCYFGYQRYLAFNPGNSGLTTALRVKNLHLGESSFVGLPVDLTDIDGSTLRVARLRSTPLYLDDWGPGPIFVGDCLIRPGDVDTGPIYYDVQAIALGQPIQNEDAYSEPLTLYSTRLGDAEGGIISDERGFYRLPPNNVVNFSDIQAVVFCFMMADTESRPYHDVEGDVPNWVVSFTDIQFYVMGFKGARWDSSELPMQYPDCPESAISCTSDEHCPPGFTCQEDYCE